MTTTTAAPPPKTLSPPPATGWPRRRTLATIAALAVFGFALSLFTVASLAVFTDTEPVPGNSFGTGDVDISALPASAVFSVGAMAPGDQVTAEIDVSNSGSLDLRYALTSLTTEDLLASTLVLTVKDGVTTCDDGNWAADGSVLHSGELGATTALPIFGDATQGAQGGDRVLASSASETLCFNVTLPSTVTSTVQGLNTTATFNFVAEQTKNNP